MSVVVGCRVSYVAQDPGIWQGHTFYGTVFKVCDDRVWADWFIAGPAVAWAPLSLVTVLS
jgi:hypothetical protein